MSPLLSPITKLHVGTSQFSKDLIPSLQVFDLFNSRRHVSSSLKSKPTQLSETGPKLFRGEGSKWSTIGPFLVVIKFIR